MRREGHSAGRAPLFSSCPYATAAALRSVYQTEIGVREGVNNRLRRSTAHYLNTIGQYR